MKRAVVVHLIPAHSGIAVLTGALSMAVTALALPALEGVVWTASEWRIIALSGLGGGGLLGWIGGLIVQPQTRWGAASTGLVTTLAVLGILWLPEVGTAKLQVPMPWVGVLVGSTLVALGLLRSWRGAVWLPVVTAGLGVAWSGQLLRWPAGPAAGTHPKPDLLLVTVDTTRADLIPAFGGDLETALMPNMAAFARESRRYTHAYAPVALTGPSHTSMLSGVRPHQHGVMANGRRIPPMLPWVPALLQSAGWSTQGFVSTAVLDSRLGFGRGFDQFDSRFMRRFRHGHPLLRVLPRRATGGAGFVRADADTVTRAINAGLTRSSAGPVFTWVHLYGPHWPYTPAPVHAKALSVPPTLSGGRMGPIPLNLKSDLSTDTITHAKALYRAELATLDDQLARLLAAIDDDTIVVIVGDHGESLDEHGLMFNHGPLSSAASTRVPLWIRAPGWPTDVIDEPVSIVDVGPTLLDLAGLDVQIPGRSLRTASPDAVVVSVASAEVFSEASDLVALPPQDTRSMGPFASLAVRSGDWSKVGSLWHATRWVHRPSDPRELVAGPTPPDATAARLEAAWDQLVAAPGPPSVAPMEAGQQAVLEALGYLDADED